MKNEYKHEKKRQDAFVLLFFIVLASVYSYVTVDTAFGALFVLYTLFLVPPTIYLSLRKKKDWIKILASVFLLGFIVGFNFSFIAELTDAWRLPFAKVKLFGVLYYQTVIMMMLLTMHVIVFYQHFFINQEKQIKGISPRYKKVLFLLVICTIVIILTFKVLPSLLVTKYSYFWLASINVLVTIIFVLRNPKLILNVFLPLIYFSILYIVMEYFGMTLGWWDFPGTYVGFVSFLGITIPVEELFAWIIFYSPTLISCYESFINVKTE